MTDGLFLIVSHKKLQAAKNLVPDREILVF